MAKSRKQREKDRKLARQGFMILAVFVGVGAWSGSRSLLAGMVAFAVVLIGLEFLFILPGLIRGFRFQKSGSRDIDSMSWHDFEKHIAFLFQARGYRTRLTPFYDFGADFIAEGNGERVAVQVKHSSGHDIGNKGVQQVVASLNYYKGTRGVVVTNRYFTQSAIDLAHANHVELWDRDRLATETLETHPSSSIPGAGSTPRWNHSSSLSSSSLPTCPRCGATMVMRHSRYGPFWGCSTFPRCWGKRQA